MRFQERLRDTGVTPAKANVLRWVFALGALGCLVVLSVLLASSGTAKFSMYALLGTALWCTFVAFCNDLGYRMLRSNVHGGYYGVLLSPRLAYIGRRCSLAGILASLVLACIAVALAPSLLALAYAALSMFVFAVLLTMWLNRLCLHHKQQGRSPDESLI